MSLLGLLKAEDLGATEDHLELRNLNGHLQLAVAYTASSWIPVSDSTLRSAASVLAAGGTSRDAVQILRKDFGAFFGLVKEIQVSRSESTVPLEDPVRFLESYPPEELIKLLKNRQKPPSKHHLSDCATFQAQRLMQSLTSALTSEAIAEAQNIDSTQAYSAALLRQLGLSLICFNYPHVYQRAVTVFEGSGGTQSLDSVLSKILGFSPTMLAVSLGRSWKLSPQLLAVMGDKQALTHVPAEDVHVLTNVDALDKICRMGETLAQLSAGALYPEARAAWPEVKKQLEEILGKRGSQVLRQRLSDALSFYAAEAPKMFEVPDLVDGALKEICGLSGKDLFKRNSYVTNCPDALHEDFQRVYQNIEAGSFTRDSIEVVTKIIATKLGFNRGCIFLVEPDALKLVPRLPIGNATLNEFNPITYSAFKESENKVAHAFRASTPTSGRVHASRSSVSTIAETAVISMIDTYFIAGVLGVSQRTGVLYLELELPAKELGGVSLEESKYFSYFKAIRQVLSDCLNTF